tara:strand:- start:389 stop:817 length:429 start_codon:yes stop_codon:yes gene_type:complete
MRVKEVAKKLSVIADTERFYTRIQLFNPHTNPHNSCKEYSQSDLERLKLIVASRALGFTVDDITTIIAKADDHKFPCPTVRRNIEKRLEETERQFQGVIVPRARMIAAMEQWENIPDRVPNGHMICHMIESFSEGLNHDASN